jgi:hypothetical protein
MAVRLTERLSFKVDRIAFEARAHPLAKLVTAQGTADGTVVATLRNVLLRVHLYGQELTRSIFHAIGRIVASDQDTAKQLVDLEFVEALHPALAFRNYVSMGGDPACENDFQFSPAAYAVAATAHALARHENPYAVLGLLHLLESTTPLFISEITPSLAAGKVVTTTEFLSVHRTQDVDHASTVQGLIGRLEERDEQTGSAIEFAFDSFSIVYPFPIWTEVLAQSGT